MINIEDRSYQPKITELRGLVNNKLFDELCESMESEFKAIQRIEYSGDKALPGWNLKFKKAGRTLCTVYPRPYHFFMLLIVGRKEKERVENILSNLSIEFQKIYNETVEGMGQRWMVFNFCKDSDVYRDAWKVIQIRRESK